MTTAKRTTRTHLHYDTIVLPQMHLLTRRRTISSLQNSKDCDFPHMSQHVTVSICMYVLQSTYSLHKVKKSVSAVCYINMLILSALLILMSYTFKCFFFLEYHFILTSALPQLHDSSGMMLNCKKQNLYDSVFLSVFDNLIAKSKVWFCLLHEPSMSERSHIKCLQKSFHAHIAILVKTCICPKIYIYLNNLTSDHC